MKQYIFTYFVHESYIHEYKIIRYACIHAMQVRRINLYEMPAETSAGCFLPLLSAEERAGILTHKAACNRSKEK
jgi:hypothetical protein